MGFPDFIGSVGGSLGLFLGFSLFSYFSLFLDSLFDKLTSWIKCLHFMSVCNKEVVMLIDMGCLKLPMVKRV